MKGFIHFDIIVRAPGIDRQEFKFAIEPYTTLRDFVTSIEFLNVTKSNPNRLVFFVNGESAKDDLLLVPGDMVTFDVPNEKAIIRAQEVIQKLKRLVGLRLIRHGGKHDVWETQDGKKVIFPRHAGDLRTGTLKNIIRQSGLNMTIDEFVQSD